MQNQSKRKFTYLGQTYNLPKYFDCSLEIYAIESDPDIFRWYSKPTKRKSLDIAERWCGTSKAEVLGPIQWDLVADHTDALKIIAENSRMGKYLSWYEANDSIFAGKCPVRFKAGTAIFKNFFNYFKEQDRLSDRLYSFKSDDCATLYKMFFYSYGDGGAEFESDIFLSSIKHVKEDLLKLKNYAERPTVLDESDMNDIFSVGWKRDPWITALSYIECLLQTSASLKEFFKSAEILKTVDMSEWLIDWSLIERPDNLLTKNSFEAFEVPPACDCEFGTVNYLSLWYQIKQQLFDIINE